MKQILIALLILCSINAKSQDTLCVMICLDEVIDFNYQTSEIINRTDHEGDFEIKVNEGEIMCLHFNDDKERFRDVTVTFADGYLKHDTFNSRDHVIFSKESWGNFTIHVSESRRRK